MAVVLKMLAQAAGDGDDVLRVILGIARSRIFHAKEVSYMDVPFASSQVKFYALLLAKAKVSPSEVTNAGTGFSSIRHPPACVRAARSSTRSTTPLWFVQRSGRPSGGICWLCGADRGAAGHAPRDNSCPGRV